jgi:hypothetical protein
LTPSATDSSAFNRYVISSSPHARCRVLWSVPARTSGAPVTFRPAAILKAGMLLTAGRMTAGALTRQDHHMPSDRDACHTGARRHGVD